MNQDLSDYELHDLHMLKLEKETDLKNKVYIKAETGEIRKLLQDEIDCIGEEIKKREAKNK